MHRRVSPRRASSNMLSCCLHSPSCPATHHISCNPSGLCSPSLPFVAMETKHLWFSNISFLRWHLDHQLRPLEPHFIAATRPVKVPPRPCRWRRPQGRSTKDHSRTSCQTDISVHYLRPAVVALTICRAILYETTAIHPWWSDIMTHVREKLVTQSNRLSLLLIPWDYRKSASVSPALARLHPL